MPKQKNGNRRPLDWDDSPECKSTDDASASELLDIVASLYLNQKHGDLIIICGAEILPAHRSIVCTQSPYFARACGENFQGISGKIEFKDLNSILLKKVLQFLYTGDYDLESLKEPLESSSDDDPNYPKTKLEVYSKILKKTGVSTSCHFHVLMYVQADYFQIDRLKERAKKYLQASFKNCPDRKSFEEIIEEVYNSTPKFDQQTRDTVVELITSDLRYLRQGDEPMLDYGFLKHLPAFAADLSRSVIIRFSDYH